MQAVADGCWEEHRGGAAGRRGGGRGDGGPRQRCTRGAVAAAIVRHVRVLTEELRFLAAHKGALVRVREMHVGQLNGAFVKVEILRAVLSQDNIGNPFVEETHAGEDSGDDGEAAPREPLNISDIRVRACVSMLCKDNTHLPAQQTGPCDATREPV